MAGKESDEFLDKVQYHQKEVGSTLQKSSFEERYDWIVQKKKEGSTQFEQKKYLEAIDTWMQALCAYDFSKYKKSKKETEMSLKIPIVNNMALAFMILSKTTIDEAKYLDRANSLLDQVLKSDPKNEKAMLRKCGVLVDIGKIPECREILEKLQVIAFDSKNSQAVYQEIKRIKQKIEEKLNPPKPKKVVPKTNGFDKENDWYYQMKQFQQQNERIKKKELEYIDSLDPISRFFYTQVYSRCCKPRRINKFEYKQKLS